MNFTNFTNLYQNLYNTLHLWGADENKRKKIELQKYASNLLENKHYEMYFKMVENGYEPTNKQTDLLNFRFLAEMNNDNYGKADDAINAGYRLDEDTFAKMFMSKPFLKNALPNIQKFVVEASSEEYNGPAPVAFAYILKCLQQPSYQKALFTSWYNLMTSKDTDELATITERNSVQLFDVFKDIWFKNVSIEQSEQYIAKIKKSADRIGKEHGKQHAVSSFATLSWYAYSALNELADMMNKYSLKQMLNDTDPNASHNQKRENILEQTRQVYIGNIVNKNMVVAQVEKSKDYHIKNLPEDVQTIITDIEKYYSKIDNIVLDTEKKFTVTNLMEQRLPEVVRKYFSIDEEYRDTLKNHEGKYPKELLQDSLHQIQSILQEVVKNANEEKINHLTVDNRYMHAVKKAF